MTSDEGQELQIWAPVGKDVGESSKIVIKSSPCDT